MSRTPLALIWGVKKLCKDLGVDPEDVRTFRFFTAMPLFVCLSFFSCAAHVWLLVSLLQDHISHVHGSPV